MRLDTMPRSAEEVLELKANPSLSNLTRPILGGRKAHSIREVKASKLVD